MITPQITITAGATGKAEAKFFTSATESLSVRVGAGYKGGSLGAIKDGSSDSSLQPPNLTGNSAEARGTLGARGGLALYGSAGAAAGFDGFVAVAADGSKGGACYHGSAGVLGTAGIFAGFVGLKIADWHDSFDIFSVDLGSGACNVQSGTGGDKRVGWIYFPEHGGDDNTLNAPVVAPTMEGGLIVARSRNPWVLFLNSDGSTAASIGYGDNVMPRTIAPGSAGVVALSGGLPADEPPDFLHPARKRRARIRVR